MQLRIICSLEIHNWLSGWIVIWECHELNISVVISIGARLCNLIPYNNGMTYSETEIRCFVTSNWKLLSLKMLRAPH